MGIEDSNYKTMQERQSIFARLGLLYSKRREILQETKSHDPSVTLTQDFEIVTLEKKLREEFNEPFALIELPQDWAQSESGKEAKQIEAQAQPLISAIQQLSSKGEQSSPEYVKLCNRLEKLGVRFACLYSDKDSALILVGDKGMVHEDVREQADQLREQGTTIPQNFTSGVLFHTRETGQYVMRVDSIVMIWTSHLGVNEDRSVRRVTAQIVSPKLHKLGEAQLLGPSMLALHARERMTLTPQKFR